MYSNQDIQNWFAQNPNVPVEQVAQIMRQNNVTPGQVAQATGRDVNEVTNLYNNALGIKTSGLASSLNTLQQGGQQAAQMIGQTQGQVADIYKQGLQQLAPYSQTGTQANQLQAALSGSLGPEAQKAAFQNITNAPGVEFAQKEAERALLRNASATGGLGGGNVLRDLSQLAAGTFLQNYNTQFGQIGEVANRGYGAATTGAGLQGQLGQVQAGLGQFAAGIPLQTAGAQSGMQFQAGRDIGSAIQGTTSSLANLIQQQGAGMTDITGSATNNIAALYQNAMNGDASAKEQLAAMLGNLSTSNASMVGNQPIIPSQPSNLLGTLGQVAGGLGGLAAGIGYGNTNTPANPTASPATSSVYGPYNTGYGLYGS